jgi:hypothetical protein
VTSETRRVKGWAEFQKRPQHRKLAAHRAIVHCALQFPLLSNTLALHSLQFLDVAFTLLPLLLNFVISRTFRVQPGMGGGAGKACEQAARKRVVTVLAHVYPQLPQRVLL